MRMRSIVVAAIALLLASPVLAAHVIVIGGPDALGDHTAAVQAALDECSFDRADCEIRFLAGTYRIAAVSAENFHGAIRGAGMDATILLPLPGQEAPDADVCLPNGFESPVSNEVLWPVMMQFAGGDIAIADLSFRVLDWAFAEDATWCDGFRGLYTIVLITGADSRSRVDRVGFEGMNGGENVWCGVNLLGGEVIHQALSGTHSVTASTFRELFWTIVFQGGSGGTYRFGGSPKEGNVARSCTNGVDVEDMTAAQIVASHNDIEASGHGMWLGNSLFASLASAPSRYTIEHNRVKVTGRMDWWVPNAAIEIADGMAAAGTPPMVLAEVTNNRVEVVPEVPEIEVRGIRVAFAHGALVANNSVGGAGSTAIDVPEVETNPSSYWEGQGVTERVTIRGNNLQGFDASLARIHLGVGSRNCEVQGNKADVLDEGLNNHVVRGPARRGGSNFR